MKELDFSKKNLSTTFTIQLFAALRQSGSVKTIESVPRLDKIHYQDENVIREVQGVILKG